MRDADAELVAAYQAGHIPALEALYWRHAERVWRYAWHFTGSEELAGDVVQEAFLRVTRHLAGFEGRASFTTWLFAIVRSAAVDLATRARKAPQPAEEAWMDRRPARTPEPDEEAIGAETRALVRDALLRLPENEREVVLLCEIEDLPLREAGEVLGWGDSRVKVTLFRARRRLRELLARHVEAKAAAGGKD